MKTSENTSDFTAPGNREIFPKAGEKKKESDHGAGIGTAEYQEKGPYHCEDCRFIEDRIGGGMGTCDEPHMLADVKSGLFSRSGEDGLAIVNLEKGCCRYVESTRK